MRIAVVALGKIGLPLAVQFARKGHETVGVDVNRSVVDKVNAAMEPFPGEAHLQEYLSDVVGSGRLHATTDYADAIPHADVVVVVVPLFVDDEYLPDFRAMDSATNSIAVNLSRDTLVIYETTLPVGTTRSRWTPALESTSGLEEGKDFQVAFSPERVLSGRVFSDLRRYPKLVGGVSELASAKAVAFYEAVLDFDARGDLVRPNGVWDLASAEAAELTKLAETTYRDVNIGLANQFACFAEKNGIDIYSVIDAANSQPYSHIHTPGIAVGGHCIPVYPRLYLWTDPDATVVSSARQTNSGMPRHAVSLLEKAHGNLAGANVLILGAAYRRGVKETAFSGVFPTVEAVEARGATAYVQDPLYSDDELRGLGLVPYEDGLPVDAVIVQTDHPEFRILKEEQFPGVKAVVDGRRVLDPSLWTTVKPIVIGTDPGVR